MTKRMRWLLCGLIFLIGFWIGIFIKLNYEKHTFQQYEWGDAPLILNCFGSDMSELSVIRAINFWTIREHHFEGYIHNPPEVLCNSNLPMFGFIVIRKADTNDLNPETLAYTKRLTFGNRMKSATIYFREGTQGMELLAEHELGHALGYAHTEHVGHIMHPFYDSMGESFWVP